MIMLNSTQSSAKVGMAVSIEFQSEQLAREGNVEGPAEVPF